MSHHYSGPDFGFPHGDARLDLTDLYAFPKPGDAGKSILIMNVHPSSGFNPPEPTTADPFATEALYELKIDTNGDAVADIAYRVRFSPSKGGVQTATLRRVEGAQAVGTGDGGQAIVEGAPVSMGREARVTQAGDYRFFAGGRSGPFFFDVRGALNNLQFTGNDFFADKDVCSIVLEVPNSALGPKEVGLWAPTPAVQRARPKGNLFRTKGRGGHLQHDAAHVFVSEEIVAGELQVVQGSPHVEEEGIATPAREETVVASLCHPCLSIHRDRCPFDDSLPGVARPDGLCALNAAQRRGLPAALGR